MTLMFSRPVATSMLTAALLSSALAGCCELQVYTSGFRLTLEATEAWPAGDWQAEFLDSDGVLEVCSFTLSDDPSDCEGDTTLCAVDIDCQGFSMFYRSGNRHEISLRASSQASVIDLVLFHDEMPVFEQSFQPAWERVDSCGSTGSYATDTVSLDPNQPL